MGIRQAYSQAYHHQANGRAERAGQQIMEKLRKLQVHDKVNWVEALPRVLDRIHDLPGETGFTPYEILFGRHRPLSGLPLPIPHVCEDALQFFNRMQTLDQKVASTLNETHWKSAERVNRNRIESLPFQISDLVMYRRPENAGNKLDSRWLGPAVVRSREGDRSYQIEIKPNVTIKAHRSFLKPYIKVENFGNPIPLFYHQRTVEDLEAGPDECIVAKNSQSP